MIGSRLNTPIRDWTDRRVWLVGASSGIGAALAQALLAAGARVALSARRTEQLAAVVNNHPHAIWLPFRMPPMRTRGSPPIERVHASTR